MSDQTEEKEASSADEGTSEETSESGKETEVSEESEETSKEETSEEASASEEDGTSEEEEKPAKLYAGRFKSVDEMERSYQNLESAYGRKSQDLRQLQTMNRGTPPVDSKSEDERLAEEIKSKGFASVFRNMARQEAEPAIKEAKSIRFETEYKTLKQNKEFVELEPIMDQIAREHEDMIVDNGLNEDPRLLHLLFYTARGVQAEQNARKAEKRGKKKGELNALKKQKVQVEGSSGSKGHTQINFEELSLDEMRKRLPKKAA